MRLGSQWLGGFRLIDQIRNSAIVESVAQLWQIPVCDLLPSPSEMIDENMEEGTENDIDGTRNQLLPTIATILQ